MTITLYMMWAVTVLTKLQEGEGDLKLNTKN